MSIYIVSECFLNSVKNRMHYAGVLYKFLDDNSPYKIAVDNGGVVFGIYERCAENNDIIKSWLDLISEEPVRYEQISLSIQDYELQEVFLKLASCVNIQNVIIVYSYQASTSLCGYVCDQECCVDYQGVRIRVLDKDAARIELSGGGGNIYVNNSVVMSGGGRIIGVNIKS